MDFDRSGTGARGLHVAEPLVLGGSRDGDSGAIPVDLILDGGGSLAWVRGPFAAPLLSRGGERLTSDQTHSDGGAGGMGAAADFEGDAEASEELGGPVQPAAAAAAAGLAVDPAAWASVQFAAAQLGDCRRVRRLVMLAEQIACDPSSSLPKQARTWGDLKGAYRLLDRPEATFEVVAAPHWQLTRDQAGMGRHLILDDTTELDFGAARRVEGLGPVGSGIGRGFMIHSGLMVAPHEEWVEGLAGQVRFHRKPAPKGETRAQRRARDRESAVWGQLIERIGPPPEGAQWVHVMDRGADDFEVHCRARRVGADWVGRVKSRNRRVLDHAGAERALSKVLTDLPAAGCYTLALRARPKRPARRAKLAVSFGAVTTLPPRQPAASLQSLGPQPLAQWVVCARELAPPADLAEPIDWVLWTSLPVENLQAAMDVIGYYEKRWLIEEWHKALKTGCQVEGRQLQTSHRLEALSGLLSVVAVRLLQLKELARRDPKRGAMELMPRHYVELTHRARRGRGRPDEWTIRDFFRAVAGLGGFLGRKGDGEPGWITIWRGWQVLHWMLQGAQLARPPTAH